MKTFVEEYKGYHIYNEDNRELTAGDPYYTATKNETVSISAWTLDDIKKIIDELEGNEIKENGVLNESFYGKI